MRLITKQQVETILNTPYNIGDNGEKLVPKNIHYYRTSFTHRSYLNEQENHSVEFTPTESFERLEFYGDSFLGAIVAKYLVDRFSFENEGFLTRIRSRLVKDTMLCKFGKYLEFGKYFLLSSKIDSLTKLGGGTGRNNPKLYEDCFEAFIGAIIADYGEEVGYKYAKRFIINLIEHLIDFTDLILNNDNYKDILQRYFQSQTKLSSECGKNVKWDFPKYFELESNERTMFSIGIFLRKELFLELSNDMQEKIIEYQQHIKKHQEESIKKSIDKYSKFDETDGGLLCSKCSRCINRDDENAEIKYYLIAFGTGSKKSIAQQQCAKIGLLNLNVPSNF